MLPTEAQWEYACRAGTDTVFWTGDDGRSLIGAANLADRQFTTLKGSHRAGDWLDVDDGFAAYAPVDALRANPWGFHNVHGNVWEWCRDLMALYDAPLEASSERRSTFNKGRRVYRGGGYNVATSASSSAMRFSSPPGAKNESTGVRPARVVRR